MSECPKCGKEMVKTKDEYQCKDCKIRIDSSRISVETSSGGIWGGSLKHAKDFIERNEK